MRSGESRSLVAVAAAGALHAAILVALVIAPLRRPAASAPAAGEVTIEMVDVAESAREVESHAAPQPPELTAPVDEPEAHEARVTREAHETREPPAAREASGAEGVAPRGVTMAGALPVDPAALGLALGAPNRFANDDSLGPAREASPARDGDRGMKPRSAAETKRAVEAALREPARQRDRELGLGPEGPVLQALGDGASASTAPVNGKAVFLAVTDHAGMVVGIEVVSCDGGRAGWAEAAELARAALKGKKLRLPSTARGAEMRIEVSSAWKLPSGHDPGTDVSLFGVPVKKGEGKQSTKLALLDPIPKLSTEQLAPGVQVPVVKVEIDLVKVQGDPADIGAKPRRIVHTRLIDSRVL